MKMKLTIFELISLHWISLALGALIFALLGIFYTWLIVLWLICDIAGSIYLIKKGIVKIQWHSRGEVVALTLLLFFAILLSLFTTPTIFGGRDEGSFSSAAILLSQDHDLTHNSELSEKFSKIYGQGKALNFPGFIYTADGDLKSQFLPGYTAWTAAFYSFFGLTGLQFVNLFSLITFLFSFYLVLKRLTKNHQIAFWGLALMATSLPVIIFYKFTLTELFFASLLWFSLHLLLRYFEKKSFLSFLLAIFPLFLTPFVRIEAVGIIFVLVLILIFMDYKNVKIIRYQFWLVALGLTDMLSVVINQHFFVEAFRGFGEGLFSQNQTEAVQSENTLSFIPDDWQGFYLPKVLFNYNVLALVFLAAVQVVILFRRKNWNGLVPFLLLAPTLIYFIDANITLDHPWMLRRFLYSIIPLALLYSMLMFHEFLKKYSSFAWFIITILLLTNIFQSIPFVTQSQNRNLLRETESFAQNFGPNNLILISQKSSGSGWSLMAEPLRNVYGASAVYFFRPSDLEQLSSLNFENIYLVVSNDETELFEDLPKQGSQDYWIKNEIIKPSRNPLEKPGFDEYTVRGKVYQLQVDSL